jgi:hypothetical protein
MNLDTLSEENQIEERLNYYGSRLPSNLQNLCFDFENKDGSAADLRALGIFLNTYKEGRVRLARFRESMPKTGIWIDEDGNYCSEHYSSKPGLEKYGFASFDTPQELFRHIWLRVVKNGIPASLMSKRNVNEKIDFDEMFPPGRELTMDQILAELKPILGGEKLAHPSDQDLLKEKTIQRLVELGLIGKKMTGSDSKTVQIVRDLTKGGKIKYYFYCAALNRVSELYKDVISEVAGQASSTLLGTIFANSEYEAWTVTNTQRMPVNSVNFRTGESILVCRLQENEMFSAVFVAIIKRTFKRAKGKTPTEKLVHPGWRANNPEMIDELNNLLADYFFEAASEIDPTVFIDKDLDNNPVSENARALLIKYLLKNGSMDLKQSITGNSNLTKYVELTTKHEDLDALTKRLINISKSLKYI